MQLYEGTQRVCVALFCVLLCTLSDFACVYMFCLPLYLDLHLELA